MEVRPVGIHHELLIAPRVRLLPLKNDLMPGAREIGFGVLPAERQLPNVLEMHFARVSGDRLQQRGQQKAYHESRKLESFKPPSNVRFIYSNE